MYTKQDAFDDINRTQCLYIDELISKINGHEYCSMKKIKFTSPTGTGKTKMMAMLINKLPHIWFIITTLSKGQLNMQVKNNLMRDCIHHNFCVYGSCDYKMNSRLHADDILKDIPDGNLCIWLRDEGHIHTNRFSELLENRCQKIIDFSATNIYSDIRCNFSHTMMLRTVNQSTGTPEDAIKKLIEVKRAHRAVAGYNPCAIFRCIGAKSDSIYQRIITSCEENNLKYIDITTEQFDVIDLCRDDNEIDVIINKFKIVEGIDIRRAHVLYMDNMPGNNSTTIQAIGRCRRNALLYRNDVDIFLPDNKELLRETRQCYVFYNIKETQIETDESGELQYAFCDHISCEELMSGTTIHVDDGQMPNGLYVLELEGQTGDFDVCIDEETGFNVVSPLNSFYENDLVKYDPDCGDLYDGYIRLRPCQAFRDMLYDYIRFKPDYDMTIKNCIWSGQIEIITSDIQSWPIFNSRTFEYYDMSDMEFVVKHLAMPGISTSFHPHRIDVFVEKIHDDSTADGFRFGISKLIFDHQIRHMCDKIINDKESAIIGVDLMRYIKTGIWIESKSVSSKISVNSKLNRYLSKRYAMELESVRHKLFSGSNDLNLNKRCNSALGYCVEYWSKWFLYGDSYLEPFLDDARKEWDKASVSNIDLIEYAISGYRLDDAIIVRACMLKYKDNMSQCFGPGVSKLIRSISIEKLIQQDYALFTKTVILLGLRTAKYVKSALYPDSEPVCSIDPNLSIRHITGLADYITHDTILDVKVRNNIDETCIRQVLAYHYLSTKRSDLDIKRVIVYDAVSDKSIVIPIGKPDADDYICIMDSTQNTYLCDWRMMKCGYRAAITKILDESNCSLPFGHDAEIEIENIGRTTSSIYDFRNGNMKIDELLLSNLAVRVFDIYGMTPSGMLYMAICLNGNKVDIEFEDGTIMSNIGVDRFLQQDIQYPENSNKNLHDCRRGTTFCGLRVIDKDDTNYKCKCTCGNIIFLDKILFESKRIKSCGCGCRFTTSLVGCTKTMISGLDATVIYQHGNYVTVRFENGIISHEQNKSDFASGHIPIPKVVNNKYNGRIYRTPNVCCSLWK